MTVKRYIDKLNRLIYYITTYKVQKLPNKVNEIISTGEEASFASLHVLLELSNEIREYNTLMLSIPPRYYLSNNYIEFKREVKNSYVKKKYLTIQANIPIYDYPHEEEAINLKVFKKLFIILSSIESFSEKKNPFIFKSMIEQLEKNTQAIEKFHSSEKIIMIYLLFKIKKYKQFKSLISISSVKVDIAIYDRVTKNSLSFLFTNYDEIVKAFTNGFIEIPQQFIDVIPLPESRFYSSKSSMKEYNKKTLTS